MSDRQPETPDPRRYTILWAMMCGSVLGPIDASIVNVVLPIIGGDFGADLAAVQWVPMSYLLTVGSLTLLFGRLGDIWGYKRVFCSGLLGFVAASALCATSPSIGWLVAFRVLQGLAAASLMAVTLAPITRVFPSTERGRALGLYAVSISAGLAVGPSLGGLLTELFGWRSVFFVNVPIGLGAFLWVRRVLPEMRGKQGKVDVEGAAAAFAALSSLLLFVNRAQKEGLTPLAGALLGAAALFAALFLLRERRAEDPILDLGLYRNATFASAGAAALLNFMSQYVIVFLTPFYLQRVLHETPGHTGLVLTASPLAVMVTAPLAGALSDRVGTRWPSFSGAGICALACLLLGFLPPSAEGWHVAWRLALFGFGTALFQSPNNSAVMGATPKQYLGVASSILATMRTVGMVFGVAAGGAVLYAFTPARVLALPQVAGADAEAFLSGLRCAFASGALFSALAALGSLFRSRAPSA